MDIDINVDALGFPLSIQNLEEHRGDWKENNDENFPSNLKRGKPRPKHRRIGQAIDWHDRGIDGIGNWQRK